MASLADLHTEMNTPGLWSRRSDADHSEKRISLERTYKKLAFDGREDPYQFNVFHPTDTEGARPGQSLVLKNKKALESAEEWAMEMDPRLQGGIRGATAVKLRHHLEVNEAKENLFAEPPSTGLSGPTTRDPAHRQGSRKNDWAAANESDLTARQKRLIEALLGVEGGAARPTMEEAVRSRPMIEAEKERVRIYEEMGLETVEEPLNESQEERVQGVKREWEEAMSLRMKRSLGLRG